MKFLINQKDLKAVSYAMAKQGIRYYLQGVNFEHNGKETRIVATDGHRLHAVIHEHKDGVLIDPVSFIMPLDMVKKCLSVKAPRQDKKPEIELSIEAGKIQAVLPDGSIISQFATDATFPDYSRIVPSDDLEIAISVFNPQYVSEAVKAYCEFMEYSPKNVPSIGIRSHGDRVGVLSANGFTALVMPMRGEISEKADARLKMPIEAPKKLKAVA
jgi:DNA polymerase-3 subunit beta